MEPRIEYVPRFPPLSQPQPIQNAFLKVRESDVSALMGRSCHDGGDIPNQIPTSTAGEEVKLRREYLYGSALREKTQNGQKNMKYKYDISKVEEDDVSPKGESGFATPPSVEFSRILSQHRGSENSGIPFSIQGIKVGSVSSESSLSGVSPFSEMVVGVSQVCQINYDQDIDSFKRKVVRVNDEIEEGINHLEEMIRNLRRKKSEQCVANSKINILKMQQPEERKPLIRAEMLKQEHEVMQTMRPELQISNGMQQKSQRLGNGTKSVLKSIPEHSVESAASSIVVEQTEPEEAIQIDINQAPTEETPPSQEEHHQERVHPISINNSHLIQDNASTCQDAQPIIEESRPKDEESIEAIAESEASLAIEEQPLAAAPNETRVFKGSKAPLVESHRKKVFFPPEYTAFINRLSNQIQLDMEFTNLVIGLSKQQQLGYIRELIFSQISKFKKETAIRESFFKVEPQEQDPLDSGKPFIMKKWSEDQLKEEAFRLYKKYKEIESHFNCKLSHRFSPEVVSMLFQDLVQFNFTKNSMSDPAGVTVGHLLSYLNMRTTKNFRNRYLVKVMRRLGLAPSACITPAVMAAFAKGA